MNDRSIPASDLDLSAAADLVGAPLPKAGPTSSSRKRPGAPKALATPKSEPSPVGFLDELSLDLISGWAWDPARPNEPVEVEVLDGDEVILTIRADLYREDLVQNGFGNGVHGLRITGLRSLTQKSRQRIHVRRAMDHVDLPGSPAWLTNETAGFDEAAAAFLERAVENVLVRAAGPEELDYPLSFLLQLVNSLGNARADRVRATQPDAPLESPLAHAPLSYWMRELAIKLTLDHPPLHIEPSEAPEVSIIIPVYNHFHHTYNCLKSIISHLPKASFEILVADDCSTDETMLCGLIFSGAIRVLRHPKNLGFIRSCNAAAAQARGRYLFFLNNDTLVREGWLDELVATFSSVPNIGIAGSKLLFEDGSLQEAGGIIWRLGDGWNWGRGRDPKLPAFCYLRDADWVSGAALMIERGLFEQLGGFDEHFAPAYYEDTDLAFRVRAAGKRVVVQPASEIVHLEGVSSGTDVAGTGTKRFQAINHRKFYQRWRDTLSAHRFNGDQPELEAERHVTKRAYFIDETVPTPDEDAGSNAALEHMKLLMELGYKVTFLPADNMAQIDPYTRNLQKIGVECLYAPHYWSVEEVFRKAARKPDLVYLHRYNNAMKYASLVRRHFPGAWIVYNVADLHFLRMERQADLEGGAESKIEAERQREVELDAMRRVDCVIVHSSFEARLIRETDPSIPVETVPWTVYPQPAPPAFETRSGMAFVGGYRHPPNVDAAEYLVADIMPRVRRRASGIVASLIGSHMPEKVRQLAREDVRAVGYVPVLRDVLSSCRLTVVPLRYGAGIKGKVLESFAHGLPCVMSEVAAEGLDLPAELLWLVAPDPELFAEKIVALHQDRELNDRIARSGLAYVTERFGRATIRAALERSFVS